MNDVFLKNPVQNHNTDRISPMYPSAPWFGFHSPFFTKTYSKEFEKLKIHTMWIIWG